MIILPMTGTALFEIESTEIKWQNMSEQIPPGKLLLTNSEAVMNREHFVPLTYKNKNNSVPKVNALDMENTMKEKV